MANADAFNFILTGNRDVPFLGYDSTQDPTNLSPQFLVGGSKNVYLNNNGNVAVRPGLKRLGLADDTEDGVVSSYEWRTNLGEELPIRVLESGKFQVLVNTVWYTIETYTGSDFSFATWWDANAQQDLLLMVNGDTTIKSWTGGIATVASTTANTITKTGTATWLEAGFTSVSQWEVTSGSIDTAGTGYQVGDKVYPIGTGIVGPATFRVDTVGGGGTITGITLLDGGISNTDQGGGQLFVATDGSGTGASLFITTGTIISKSIVINGSTYFYTGGENSTTLTGVTPSVAAVPAGSLVFQAILSIDNMPNATDPTAFSPIAFVPRMGAWSNDFILVLANQLIVFSLTSRVIYISADTNYQDFSNGGDRVSGDPDFIVLDNFPNAAAIRTGSAFVSAGDSDWYKVTPNTPAPVAVPITGGDGYVITAVEKQPGSAGTACLGFNFVDTIGDSVVYLSQDHQVRLLGTERNLYQVKYTSLTQQVRTEFFNTDFTGGALRMIGEFIYLTAPEIGQTFLYQTRDELDSVSNVTAKRIWHPPQEWGASRIAVISSLIYAHSSSQPQIYQVWETNQWHDDSPSDTPSPYECVARFAYQNNGLKTGQISFNMCYYEGYITPNSVLNGRVRFDYLGGTKNDAQQGVQEFVISSNEDPAASSRGDHKGTQLFMGQSVAELGVSQVGAQQAGGTTNLLQGYPKFRVIQDIEPTDVFEYQVELFSYSADSRWEVKAYGANPTQSTNNPTFLRKS